MLKYSRINLVKNHVREIRKINYQIKALNDIKHCKPEIKAKIDELEKAKVILQNQFDGFLDLYSTSSFDELE